MQLCMLSFMYLFCSWESRALRGISQKWRWVLPCLCSTCIIIMFCTGIEISCLFNRLCICWSYTYYMLIKPTLLKQTYNLSLGLCPSTWQFGLLNAHLWADDVRMVGHMRVNVYEGPMASLGCFIFWTPNQNKANKLLSTILSIGRRETFYSHSQDGIQSRSIILHSYSDIDPMLPERHIFLLQNTSLYINCLWLTGASSTFS